MHLVNFRLSGISVFTGSLETADYDGQTEAWDLSFPSRWGEKRGPEITAVLL